MTFGEIEAVAETQLPVDEKVLQEWKSAIESGDCDECMRMINMYGTVLLHCSVLLKYGNKTRPALCVSSLIGHLNVTQYLLSVGADANVKDSNKMSPLHYASCFGYPDIVELLLSHAAHVNEVSGEGLTALHHASCTGHPDIVKLLLFHDAQVNKVSDEKLTALHYASRYGRTDIAELLLSHGAQVNALSGDGLTALHYASWYGNNETVELLLSYGAHVDAMNGYGLTALHYASFKGRTDIVKLLLSQEADVDAVNTQGFTSLHFACLRARHEVIRILIGHDADYSLLNEDDHTALHCAMRSGNENTANIMKDTISEKEQRLQPHHSQLKEFQKEQTIQNVLKSVTQFQAQGEMRFSMLETQLRGIQQEMTRKDAQFTELLAVEKETREEEIEMVKKAVCEAMNAATQENSKLRKELWALRTQHEDLATKYNALEDRINAIAAAPTRIIPNHDIPPPSLELTCSAYENNQFNIPAYHDNQLPLNQPTGYKEMHVVLNNSPSDHDKIVREDSCGCHDNPNAVDDSRGDNDNHILLGSWNQIEICDHDSHILRDNSRDGHVNQIQLDDPRDGHGHRIELDDSTSGHNNQIAPGIPFGDHGNLLRLGNQSDDHGSHAHDDFENPPEPPDDHYNHNAAFPSTSLDIIVNPSGLHRDCSSDVSNATFFPGGGYGDRIEFDDQPGAHENQTTLGIQFGDHDIQLVLGDPLGNQGNQITLDYTAGDLGIQIAPDNSPGDHINSTVPSTILGFIDISCLPLDNSMSV